MDNNMELIIMNLVVDSGSARSFAMEAIAFAKNGDLEAADKAMEECNEQLLRAHHTQTDLIQKEAGGEQLPISLLMVHAQDHLMTAMAVRDMAKEIIDLYRRLDG